MRAGTKIRHGRRVIIYYDGLIEDEFYKDDQLHGPHLYINFNGNYTIAQFENGK